MKATTSCVGGRAPPRRNWRRRKMSLARRSSVLLCAAPELGPLLGREATLRAGVHLGLLHPGAQRLDADAELAGHPGDHAVVAGIGPSQLEDHTHGTLLQLRRVPLRCGVLLFHDSNLSKVWSLQETQAGSASHRVDAQGHLGAAGTGPRGRAEQRGDLPLVGTDVHEADGLVLVDVLGEGGRIDRVVPARQAGRPRCSSWPGTRGTDPYFRPDRTRILRGDILSFIRRCDTRSPEVHAPAAPDQLDGWPPVRRTHLAALRRHRGGGLAARQAICSSPPHRGSPEPIDTVREALTWRLPSPLRWRMEPL